MKVGLREVAQIPSAAVAKLHTLLPDRVILPGDGDYEAARRVWNHAIDRRPGMIVRCGNASDVAAAVAFARENDLLTAVRGGGHSVAGLAVCDGGMVIDLSPMKQIEVDRERAVARAGAGLTLGEFDTATQAIGMATTMGTAPPTGIAGLTLGGGYGWLMGKYGLACDNLLGVEIVTADGRIHNANADENPDLYWAVRGGGGNFGVATRFDYRLHAQGPVLGGMVAYPVSRVRDVLDFYREFTSTAPDELTTFAGLTPGPDGNPVAAVTVCYSGDLDAGERALKPLRSFGSPVADLIRPMPYVEMQKVLDVPPGPLCGYWKGGFVREVTDGAVDALVDAIGQAPIPSLVVFEHFHGAVARVATEATAFSHRNSPHNLLILSLWIDPSQKDRIVRWVRESWNAMRQFTGAGVYVNALADDGEGRIREAYGPNYERLRTIKRRYDPDNFFRLNQNIEPAP
jgi:FAD/FMN-containing dehydrogenase